MAELAAHLVDGVLGGLPVRQWVLTLPYRLRYALPWDHRLCRAVLAVFIRAVLGFERRRGIRSGVGGAVTGIQRFGSALNTNVRFQTLVAQGVLRGAKRYVALHSRARTVRLRCRAAAGVGPTAHPPVGQAPRIDLTIGHRAAIDKILRYLGLPGETVEPAPPRHPSWLPGFEVPIDSATEWPG
jgi:hypothetical protein